MSSQGQTVLTQMNTPDEVKEVKRALYGNYEEHVNWMDDLHKKAAHKALDIKEDPGTINAPQTHVHQGLGKLGATLLTLTALMGGGGATLGVASLLGLLSPQAQYAVPPQGNSQSTITDEQRVMDVLRNFEVRFFDKDGNPISVPHISERTEDGS